ncbi:type 12 methyltransferase [Dethiosulfatarculus sandiegensis]|uniref:Type 12 methyltransferase n=2 Tax=Dethiosulfatarculus sandiegensis TaxID=1429043 RepID=A0A0D2J4R5_9BACT|nr:type 12 methyltransferase [Dethiosulfatarculus sandiegensis]
MRKMPSVDLNYSPLHEIAMGPIKAALMNCAIKYKVFDQLTTPRTPREVAGKLGFHPDNTRRLLDALTTIDLLHKKAGFYCNQPLAQAFLVSDSGTSVSRLMMQTQHEGLNPLEKLEQLVAKGPMGQDEAIDLADEKMWTEEVKSSAGWVFGGVGQLVAGIIAELPGFSSFEKMLDLGCGHGVFSLFILDKNPDLKGVLMDRAPVLDAAAEIVSAYQAKERVDFLAGDYLADQLGAGYDLVYASATLNFALGTLDSLFTKIFHSLKPGGYFVSFQDGMTEEQTKPDTMLGAVIPSMMMGHDYCFPQGMIAETAISCGFQKVRSKTLKTPIGEMDIDICQKGG